MSITLTNLGYQALRDIGCLRPGQTTSADVLADILAAANQMVDAWTLDRFLVPAIGAVTYTLTPEKRTYTIGPGADLNGPRPMRIEEANIILNTVTPTVRKELAVIQDDQWSKIAVQDIAAAIPLELWYPHNFDPATQRATLYLWPGPQSPYQLELFTDDFSALQQFADLVTAYTFAAGYERFIRKQLGVEIAPMMRIYAKVPGPGGIRGYDAGMLAEVKRQALEARDALETYNTPIRVLRGNQYGSTGGSRRGFNYAIGQ